MRRPLARLEQAGRGIILLHDIHSRTVAALPGLLKGLKERGYKVVHVAPAGEQAKTATAAADWRALDRSLLKLPAAMRPHRQSQSAQSQSAHSQSAPTPSVSQ
jgi:hypothetical protein